MTSDNFEAFLERSADKQKLLYFTDKRQTNPVMKAISKKYLGQISFGEVRNIDSKLVDFYRVDRYPTLMVITESFTVGEVYQGEHKID